MDLISKEKKLLMAKDSLTSCKFYEAFGVCPKGRTADHSGYCQKCDKYLLRVREQHRNRKREKLEKLRKKVMVGV